MWKSVPSSCLRHGKRCRDQNVDHKMEKESTAAVGNIAGRTTSTVVVDTSTISAIVSSSTTSSSSSSSSSSSALSLGSKERQDTQVQQQQQQQQEQKSTGRRRSSRGNSSISSLAGEMVQGRKRVVFVTGAGISVASGVRPFRGTTGVWKQHIWTTATRAAFRKDPLGWYNDFYLKSLRLPKNVAPNDGHMALDRLLGLFPDTLRLITQNVDGLHNTFSSKLRQTQPIEAHGRLGLFKCIPTSPDDDSDTDDDSDDDDDRLVHLGHRRKHRARAHGRAGVLAGRDGMIQCPYQQHESVPVNEVEPLSTRVALQRRHTSLTAPPRCPHCRSLLAPQALLFDEGYHSHDFYEFEKMENWLAEAEIIVFVGTSFQVRLSEVILDHARTKGIAVYNFNTDDMLAASATLNAANVRGNAEVTLPLLLQEAEELMERASNQGMMSKNTLQGGKVGEKERETTRLGESRLGESVGMGPPTSVHVTLEKARASTVLEPMMDEFCFLPSTSSSPPRKKRAKQRPQKMLV